MTAPPLRLADLFASHFEDDPVRRLALLRAASPASRLAAVTSLLSEARDADSGGGTPPQPAGGPAHARALRLQQQLAALRRELAQNLGGAGAASPPPPPLILLPPGALPPSASIFDPPPGGGGGGGPKPPDEPDDDDFASLEARLVEGGAPPAVLKAARSELRKLRRGPDGAPGAGAARAWVRPPVLSFIAFV